MSSVALQEPSSRQRSPRAVSTTASTIAAHWRSGRRPYSLWLLPVLYAVVLLSTRLLTSQSLEFDEAEQMFFTQRLAWGYSLQPPLYTWLSYGALQVFGANLFALTLVKAALITGLFVLVAAILRRLDVPRPALMPVALALLFCPYIAWNFTLNLTHTALAGTIFAATLLQALRLIKRPRVGNYLLLGVLCALGTLAKYNFLVYAAALFLAGLSLPRLRAILLDGRMLLAGGLGLVLLAPHLLWVLGNHVTLGEELHYKIGAGRATGPTRLIVGFGALLQQSASLLFPISVALLLCLGRNVRKVLASQPYKPVELDVVQRTGGIIVALMCLIVVLGANRFMAGWLVPGLILLPCILGGRLALDAWPGSFTRRLRLGVVAVILGVAAIKLGFYGVWHGRNVGRDLLFAEAAREIRAQGLSERGFVADSLLTAGNLRFHCSQLAMTCLHTPLFPLPADQAESIFVWNATFAQREVAHFLDTANIRAPLQNPAVRIVELERHDLHPRFRRLAWLDLPRAQRNHESPE